MYAQYLLFTLIQMYFQQTSQQHQQHHQQQVAGNNQNQDLLSGPVYPWGMTNFQDRQENILTELRKNLFIDLKSETININLRKTMEHQDNDDQSSILIHNRLNKEYKINIKQSESPLITHNGITNASIIHKRLDGLCGYHQEDPYWSFEWCHRKEVRQVHFEYVQEKLVRSPDWSLGKFYNSHITRERQDNANSSAVITQITDYYKNGQHCDETNDGRKTTVFYSCCDDTNEFIPPVAPPVHTQLSPAVSGTDPNENTANIVRIKTVKESNICEYEVHICVPMMCVTNATTSEEETRKDFDKKLLLAMSSLKSTCLVHSEGWWTFELCFDRSIRQFHLHQEVTQNGANIEQKQVIQGEFSLGHAPLAVYTNSTALRQSSDMMGVSFYLYSSTASLTSSDSTSTPRVTLSQLPSSGMPLTGLGKVAGPKSVILEFIGGTKCDIEAIDRASTVHISCGPRDAIIDVVEDRTCHYNIKVTSPSICQLSDFAPTKQIFERIEFIKVSKSTHKEASSSSPDRVTVNTETDEVRPIPKTRPQMVRKGVPVVTVDSTNQNESNEKKTKKRKVKK